MMLHLLDGIFLSDLDATITDVFAVKNRIEEIRVEVCDWLPIFVFKIGMVFFFKENL